MPQNQKQQLGSLVAAAELWPAQGLPKGAAVPSPTLRDALARPEPGASLLVYAACEQVPCSDNSNSVHRVYLRMCQRRSAVGDVAAAALLLPPGEGDAVPDGGLEAEPGQAAVIQRPAAPGGGAPLSPAMRARGGTPAALSPAMRGRGGIPPMILTPAAFRGSGSSRQSPASVGGGGSRGRSGSVTPQSSGRGPAAAPSTPSSASGASGGRAASADRSREQARAKAEALLATLLTKGACWQAGMSCVFLNMKQLAAGAMAKHICCQATECMLPYSPADPSPRVRQMVEALLLRHLAGCRLLAGNLVALPIFRQQALFAVEHVLTEAAAAEPAAEAGGGVQLPPPITASSQVHVLLEGEEVPHTGQSDKRQDLPSLAAAAAASALGCSPDDAGAQAARRAAAAGLASRGITFAQLGGAVKQVRHAGERRGVLRRLSCGTRSQLHRRWPLLRVASGHMPHLIKRPC